jgi:hypothetical protein
LLRRSVKIWRKTLFVTSALIGSLALPAAAHAQFWVGGASGNYNDAANWSPGQVPGQNDFAFFNPSNTTNLTLTAPINRPKLDFHWDNGLHLQHRSSSCRCAIPPFWSYSI